MKNKYWLYLDTSKSVVRWNVATGVISPPHLIEKNIALPSQFLRSRLVKGVKQLELEGKLEEIRKNKFPEKISRMNCLFVFNNESEAKKAVELWGSANNHFNDACLSEVEAIDPYKFSKHDSNWITYHEDKDLPENWIDLYWNGTPCPNYEPLWEILIDGRIKVLNQEIRQECYNRFEQDMRCTFLLKLSIMAPIAHSDLGKICSFLKKEGNCNIMVSIIKFNEDEAIRVFNAIKESYPEQASMIKVYNQNTLCICPDFRDEDYCLTHKCNPLNCPNI